MEESPIEGMSKEQFDEARSKGKIIFRPKVKDGKVHFANGRTHKVDAKGTHTNLTPRVRMSKKARRKMRREAFADET